MPALDYETEGEKSRPESRSSRQRHLANQRSLNSGGGEQNASLAVELAFEAIQARDNASEVATLTFLRSKGIPVPEVYGWSSATDNPKHTLKGIVNIEKKLFSIPFGAIGSLTSRAILHPGFKARWRDPKNYLSAIAEKEVKWIGKFGKPLESDFPFNMIFRGMESHVDYLRLLKKYLATVPSLLPKEKGPRSNLIRPILRHQDLAPSNVFVCPDTFKVTLFENPEPGPFAVLTPPKYLPDYGIMTPEQIAQVDELRRELLKDGVRLDNDSRDYHAYREQPDARKVPSCIKQCCNKNGGIHAAITTLYISTGLECEADVFEDAMKGYITNIR
ncbi:uncharacterized protein BO97DRAFT_420227 [Aspergillus homomorphus CBS 101889]|uniref:Altered inheritance of mitochondria protein 9, mitochondrial n=1 Tax=Aspergillus homomorphus (strain CBS 101889) TaxID=1450537 RepID=A0A395IF80_ASPHC|nr:hypothetical protein BO97DRAFT_420227 [Aspergillus homomorphus CBS 101889]RAL16834.1 hypothetical protein BO97DRAFT_420227 [Aspergillus homomorphus CBS 101889]